jgi:hypothetical protein
MYGNQNEVRWTSLAIKTTVILNKLWYNCIEKVLTHIALAYFRKPLTGL